MAKQRLRRFFSRLWPTVLLGGSALLFLAVASPEYFQKLWPPVMGGSLIRLSQLTSEWMDTS